MTTSQKISETSAKNNHHRKRLLILFFFITVLISLVYLLYWFSYGRYHETTDDAYVGGNAVQVMSQIPGQVMQIFYDVTEKVEKGQIIAVLDKTDAQIALDQAKSNLGMVVRTVKQYYDKVKQLQANVLIKQDNFQKVQEDYTRRKGLIINKTISKEEFQHADNAVNTARDEVTLAKEQLASALSEVGNTSLYHHPQVEQAIVALRHAYINWLRTTIYAPETGLVAKRPVQVGQQITPNTVLFVIVPLHQEWVDANFKESQIRNICIGQAAEIISDVYGSSVKYRGKVIGLSPGTGSTFDLLPAQNSTGNWIKIIQRVPIRIAINEEDLKTHPLQLGLSMAVTINTHERKCEKLTSINSPKILYQTNNYRENPQELEKLIQKILNENSPNVQLPIFSN